MCQYYLIEENGVGTVGYSSVTIEEKQYEACLIARGIPANRIQKYGFAFEGKKVLIGADS